MKKRHASWTALLLTIAFLASLTGCGTAASSAASTGGDAAQTAEAATSETTAADGQGTASEAQSDESALPDPEGAATFSYAQCEEAALRAQQYWYADMTTGPAAYRNALVDSVAASVVPYETCIYDEDLLPLLSLGEEGKTPLDRVYAGTDILVEVYFYVEYQPEINYLGPQYGDGLNSVYILAPVDTAQPCEPASGWQIKQMGDRMPRPGQTLMADNLTIYQSRMVLHQCQALAEAGLRDFTTPADWTEEELYRYLYYRGQDFGLGEDTWQNKEVADSYGNLLLTIDFTQEDDWSNNQRFLSAEWPGFSAGKVEEYTAGLDGGAVPGYQGLHTGWQFGWEDDILVVKMQGQNGNTLQEYRFRTYEGFDAWNGRTYCIGGEALA